VRTRVVNVAGRANSNEAWPAPTFKSGIDVVRLDVSVVDRNGAPVRGLTAADFIVTDQGIRQEVQSLAVDPLPLSVQLVLDVSASVSGRRLERLISAANGLLAALRPGDRAGLVTFSHMLLVDEMRARYVLAFAPPRPVRPGWHELKVRLRRGGSEITARRGYFVAAP
jgi:hypothetical protein